MFKFDLENTQGARKVPEAVKFECGMFVICFSHLNLTRKSGTESFWSHCWSVRMGAQQKWCVISSHHSGCAWDFLTVNFPTHSHHDLITPFFFIPLFTLCSFTSCFYCSKLFLCFFPPSVSVLSQSLTLSGLVSTFLCPLVCCLSLHAVDCSSAQFIATVCFGRKQFERKRFTERSVDYPG